MKWPTIIVAFFAVSLMSSAVLAQETWRPQQRAAQAQPQAATERSEAEVIVLHALNDGKGIDPKIGKMPQLKQPPFSAYSSYRLLHRGRVNLVKGKDATLVLPNKGKVVLQLKSVSKTKKGKRFVLATRIDKANGSKFFRGEFKAKPRNIFFVAGERHGKGILVVGIRVTTQ